jgi:hypothetical protein
MSKRRKRNWYAGLMEQAERARRIQEEHIRAWYDEQARGAFGKPGSTWSSRWPRSSGPLNYPVVADTARAMAMRGAPVFEALVRIERLAEISRQRLQLDKPRKPPAPSLKDSVASRRPAS